MATPAYANKFSVISATQRALYCLDEVEKLLAKTSRLIAMASQGQDDKAAQGRAI